MTDTASHTSYDDVPYPSAPMPQTHPDRLATLATLFGMDPPPVEHCRVLELGCADAGNLLAMADGLPGSRFVGIDLSARHIAAGRAAAAAVGLSNVMLWQMSISDVPADLGTFDYIVCHGVFSWVPRPVQDRILAVCKRHLAANGVAYVSYNTYPGWHVRGLVRDLMRYHTRTLTDPQTSTTEARDLLAFLVETVPAEHAAYAGFLREEQEWLRHCKDSYVFHEHLEEVNEPVYFHELMGRSAHHGLQYLAEADISTMLTGRLPPHVSAALGRLGGDLLGQQQYLDFLINRTFRQTLLCHQEVPLRRELRPELLPRFHVAARARWASPSLDVQSARVEEFIGPNGVRASTGHAISKMALVHLAQVWPQAVPFDALEVTARARLVGDAVVVQDAAAYARDTRLLAENLLQAFTAAVVELHVHAPRLVTEPGERPRAGALARWQAGQGPLVTNARHQVVNLDPLSCHFLRHLDGSRGHTALVEVLVRAALENGIAVERHGRRVTDPDRLRCLMARELGSNLARLARSGLLVPPEDIPQEKPS
jgi:methyltransferase-like protein/cyclopropane fatty-acyl-phospholipid synthase-like methyltransferase